MSRRAPLAAAALALLVAGLLSRGHREVGYVRDEGIYFDASRAYAEWGAAALASPGQLFDAGARDRAFSVNHEHPALLKLLAGFSARLFSAPGPPEHPPEARAPAGLLPLLPEGAAMRLPAQLLAGLGAALLLLAGLGLARRSAEPDEGPVPSWHTGAGAGLLAALWFIGLPQVWYHAGLHCFDVPVAVLTLAVVLCYRRALSSPRAALALGPLLGAAIAVKHNALFIPVLLGVHYLASLALDRRRPILAQLVPLPFVSMALLAPLTAFALWPWLWSDPLARTLGYFEFHRYHAYYNTEYLGTNFNQPPLPWSYPWTLTWATVPTVSLLLALVGLVLALRRDVRARPASAAPSWRAPLGGSPPREGLLWALFALFPLVLISFPSIPIFGGTKHWITAYPFLALAAAAGWRALWGALELRGRARVLPLALVPVALAPALWATYHGHPFGVSQYAPLVGGARGAADLGLLRGFWGGSIVPLLPEIGGGGARLYPHDLHDLSILQYRREGRWPEETSVVPVGRATAGLLFHERHMLTYEVDLWNHLGTTAPIQVLSLDDVPLTSVYARPLR